MSEFATQAQLTSAIATLRRDLNLRLDTLSARLTPPEVVEEPFELVTVEEMESWLDGSAPALSPKRAIESYKRLMAVADAALDAQAGAHPLCGSGCVALDTALRAAGLIR